jgi:hypothetical protein
MERESPLSDLISLKEAARLIPSGRAGKRLHYATLYRWVLTGRVPAVKIGGRYFLRRVDLEALSRPVEVGTEKPDGRKTRAARRWVDEYLDRVGV